MTRPSFSATVPAALGLMGAVAYLLLPFAHPVYAVFVSAYVVLGTLLAVWWINRRREPPPHLPPLR